MKRLLPVALITILAISLVWGGCSTSSQPTATIPPAKSPVSIPATAPSTPATAPLVSTPAVSSATIKIGLMASLSGPPAFSAKYFTSAVELAVDDANAAGGLLGKKIELITKDDQANPAVVTQRLDELKAAGCVAYIGCLTDDVSAQAIQWANDNKALLVNPDLGIFEYRTTKFSKYVFFAFPPSFTDSKLLAQITARQDIKSVSFISNDQSSYRENYKFYWDEMSKLKSNVTDLGATWVGIYDSDFTSIISATLAKNPDMIIAGLGGPGWVSFIQQAVRFNVFSKTIVAGLRLLTADTVAPFGKDYPKGIQTITYSPFYLDIPSMKTFSQKYLTKAEIYPGDMAMGYHIAALSVLTAIKSANSTDTESMIKALETASFDSPTGSIRYSDFDHQAVIPIWAVTTGYSDAYPIAIGLNPTKYGEEVYPTRDEILALRSSK